MHQGGDVTMSDESFALFDTAIGSCGVVWNGRGICSVQLPERSTAATRARLTRFHPEASEAQPAGAIMQAIEAMTGLLSGAAVTLDHIAVDLDSAPDFNRRVYEVTRSIPPGRTLTYGEVASRVGEPHAAQAVGQALGRNPVPIVVPCHRVLGAGGQIGGFSAAGGAETKRRMLVIEGGLADQQSLFG
jgi:methylated-DNA-[protein]-cysteine S-methyltransferase